MLNVPQGCQEGQTCNPWGHQKPALDSAKFWDFDYVIRDFTRILVCFSWLSWRPPKMNLGGWERLSEKDNLFWGHSEMIDQLNPGGGDPANGDGAFLLTCAFSWFWLGYTGKLTCVWRHERKVVHVLIYNTCLRKKHSGSSYVLSVGICLRKLSTERAIGRCRVPGDLVWLLGACRLPTAL